MSSRQDKCDHVYGFKGYIEPLGDAVHWLHGFAQPPAGLKLLVLTAIWASAFIITAFKFISFLLNPGLYIPVHPPAIQKHQALCGQGR